MAAFQLSIEALTSATTLVVASAADLRSVDPVAFPLVRYHGSDWRWNGAIPVAVHRADVREGLFVAPAATAPGAWERVLDGGRMTFRMFGAAGDGTTDDSAAVNAAADILRTAAISQLPGINAFVKYLDGEFLAYRVAASVNFTGIRGRQAAILNATFHSAAAGRIALDFTGSQNLWLDNLYVWGDSRTPPAVGFFFGRIDDGGSRPYPTAQANNLGKVEYAGTFTKAGFMNAASEVMHIDTLKGANLHWSNRATGSVFAGHTDVIDAFCGMPTSDFQPIGLGSQSLSSVIIDNHNPQRSPAYGLPILAITRTNPAVVSIAPANAATATEKGLANGARVFLDAVTGSTPGWGSRLSWKVFTVADLDVAAGTFALAGVDGSALAGSFTAGTLRNDTGPATVLGQVALYKEGGGYQVAYSEAPYQIDLRHDVDWTWRVRLAGRHETASDHLVRLVGNGASSVIRGLSVESDNVAARTSLFQVSGVTGSGDVTIHDIGVRLGHPAQTPVAGLFDKPSQVRLHGGRIVVPSVDFTHEVSALKASSVQWEFGQGRARVDGAPIFQAPRANTVAVVAATADDGTAPGPLVDLKRLSASPAVADHLAALRWIGQNSAAAEVAYATLRIRLTEVAAAAEGARLQVILMTDGTQRETHSFERGMFRYVTTYTVADLPAAAPVGSTAYVTNGRKNGEAAGRGTGVLCFKDATKWIACDSGAPVAA